MHLPRRCGSDERVNHVSAVDYANHHILLAPLYSPRLRRIDVDSIALRIEGIEAPLRNELIVEGDMASRSKGRHMHFLYRLSLFKVRELRKLSCNRMRIRSVGVVEHETPLQPAPRSRRLGVVCRQVLDEARARMPRHEAVETSVPEPRVL